MFQSLRIRLIASVACVLTMVLLAVGVLVYVLIARQLDELVDAQLQAAVSRGIFAPQAASGGESGDGVSYQVRMVSESARPLARRGRIGTADGDGWHEVARTGAVPAGVPIEEALHAAEPGRDDLRTVTIDGEPYRVLTRVAGDENRSFMAVQAGVSLAARDRQERIVLLALGGGGVLGLALTVAGSLYLTGRALVPAREAFERQQRFVADASHELRTPLALLRLEAEDMGERLNVRQEARPLIRQVDRITRLVESLLSLARMDEGDMLPAREPVPVQPLLETARAQAERLAAAGVRVECTSAADLWVAGDPDQLRQVLLILIDNACRATPAGGTIDLRAEGARDGVMITVADTGPGIPADHLSRVFERFYRADKARSRGSGGAGLGLSIAKEIVTAHGGVIWLESEEGRGTRGRGSVYRPRPGNPAGRSSSKAARSWSVVTPRAPASCSRRSCIRCSTCWRSGRF
jgi:signal transduction histidine kinase